MKTDVILTYRKTQLLEIPLEFLETGTYQPRQAFSKEGLESLAQTIRHIGILEPLAVRKINSHKDRYEIIAGERRFRAAKLVGLATLPCVVGNYSDEEAAQIALIENTSREDLNPISKARAMKRLIEEFHYTHEQLGSILGMERSMISNQLRLLKLDPRIQVWIYQGHLSEGHGKVLAGVAYEKQYLLAHKSIRQSLSVRMLEKDIETSQKKKKQDANLSETCSTVEPTEIKKLEYELSLKLGTPVTVKMKENGSGYFRIDFAHAKNMQEISDKLALN